MPSITEIGLEGIYLAGSYRMAGFPFPIEAESSVRKRRNTAWEYTSIIGRDDSEQKDDMQELVEEQPREDIRKRFGYWLKTRNIIFH
jgi:hypothetical protein